MLKLHWLLIVLCWPRVFCQSFQCGLSLMQGWLWCTCSELADTEPAERFKKTFKKQFNWPNLSFEGTQNNFYLSVAFFPHLGVSLHAEIAMTHSGLNHFHFCGKYPLCLSKCFYITIYISRKHRYWLNLALLLPAPFPQGWAVYRSVFLDKLYVMHC